MQAISYQINKTKNLTKSHLYLLEYNVYLNPRLKSSGLLFLLNKVTRWFSHNLIFLRDNFYRRSQKCQSNTNDSEFEIMACFLNVYKNTFIVNNAAVL